MALTGRFPMWYFSVFATFVLFSCASCNNTSCSTGITTKGYTVPRGDIVIEYGNPLDILCILNDAAIEKYGQNASSRMSFYKDNISLPKEMIEIVNSSSIRLYVPAPPLGPQASYGCTFDGKFVCMNFVFVGRKPQPVTDFKCIGYNFQNLTCTWTPLENFVYTKYTLNYTLKARRPKLFQCPEIEHVKNSEKLRCVWTIGTTPPYRQVHREYTFILTAKNKFGEFRYNDTFVHFKHVLPGRPENLRLLGTTTSSIRISWRVPAKMESFPPGLHHRVLYQCEFEEKKWNLATIITDQLKERTIRYNLTGIKHPHVLCDIRVSVRSAEAQYMDDSMWSNNASVTALTKSAIPAEPPQTDVGSFEVVVNGADIQTSEIYIYWKQIPEEKCNGPSFRYHVTIEGDPTKKPENLTSAYAKFTNMSIAQNYVFNIWSKNVNGTSVEKSVVRVPRQIERVGEPISFTKVEYEDGVYELNWEPSKLKNANEVTNFTIFWCNNERDRPYQCTGKLDWVVVSANRTSFNQTLTRNKIYQFAISANTPTSSSGMLWASCTVIYNKSMGKMKNVWISRVGSRSIELGWKLDCSNRVGNVEGYVIYYCPILSPTQAQCKTPQRNHTVYGDSNIVHAMISDLTPYSTYMLTISVMTRHTSHSPVSDPLFNTTLEEAPSSPPQNFHAVTVTNSSITVQWDGPSAINGKLKYYEIKYNDKYIQLTDIKRFTIENLTSYEKYAISIRACTIFCSSFSESLHVTTLVGYPGKIDQPTARFLNKSAIEVVWKPPQPPRGKTEFYEVQVKQKYQNADVSLQVINVTGLSYWIEDCGEDGMYDSFYIIVRAVNLVGQQRYEGPWSGPFESYCEDQPTYTIYIIVCLSALGFLIVAFYFTKKLYLRCKIMRDVEVKLPPGLAPVINLNTLIPWNSEKLTDDQHNSPPGKETIPARNSEESHLDDDSSGCSSGHESARSSLKSRSPVSNTSDSGTEHLRSQSTEELRDSLSRLRSLPSSDPAPTNHITMPLENLVPTVYNSNLPASGYCILGVAPATSSTTNSSYVPVTNVLQDSEAKKCSPPINNDTEHSMHLPSVPSTHPQEDNGYVVMSPPELIPGGYCVLGADPTTKSDVYLDTKQLEAPLPEDLMGNTLRLRNVPSARTPAAPSNGYVVLSPDASSAVRWTSAPTPPENYCVLGVDPN